MLLFQNLKEKCLPIRALPNQYEKFMRVMLGPVCDIGKVLRDQGPNLFRGERRLAANVCVSEQSNDCMCERTFYFAKSLRKRTLYNGGLFNLNNIGHELWRMYNALENRMGSNEQLEALRS